MKVLKDILNAISRDAVSKLEDKFALTEITLVTADSRYIRPGSVFVAVVGEKSDGHVFIQEAYKKGAVLVVGEREQVEDIPYIRVPDSRRALAQMAACLEDYPSHSMKVIGVTGTSGKTTMTYLLESILNAAGENVGVIGTINVRYAGKVIPSTHTTPGSVELQRILASMRDAGCTAAVMEVSSHALKQKRVEGVEFDAAVFTNLTPEHQDFHPNMEDYFYSKAILFRDLAEWAALKGKSPVAAVNTADTWGQRLAEEIRLNKLPRIIPYGEEMRIHSAIDGISGSFMGVQIQSALVGEFNCMNIAGAVAAAKGLGIAPVQIAKGILDLKSVPGRLERVPNSRGLHIWVDFAHKPDALEKVLETLRKIKGGGRLITVFGCGGDRDRKKRPVMGQIAGSKSDYVYVTSDNPRTEDPDAIVQEIVAGLQGFSNYFVEPDRQKAIVKAIGSAQAGDLVLIAGKGHEDYQITGTEKVHFDDREQAQMALNLRH